MAVEAPGLPINRPTFPSLFWGMIRRPAAALTTIRESGGRTWIWMAAVMLALSILPSLVSAPIVARQSAELIRENLEKQQEMGQEITPEMQAQAAQFSTSPIFTMIFPSLLRIIGMLLTWLVWSGALHLLCTMLGGSDSFRQMWRAVVWTWVPFALRSLLQTGFVLFSGELLNQPGLSSLVPSSTAGDPFAVPGTGELVLRSLLGQIDLFVVWNLALLVLAVSITARISRRKGALITLTLWVVLTLISLVPTLISASVTRSLGGM